MIIYTSIARGKSAGDYAEQWAAIGGDDLIVWQKHSANPILSEQLHGDRKINDWRDPFVFRDQGRTYLVAGGNLNRGKGGQAVVVLYEAENSELTKWKYLGVLFTHPDPEVGNIECPNFFKLGHRWVLVVSPHRKVEYFIGTFDGSTHKFTAESRGVMDYGNYYAPNCLYDPAGRLIMWGWINGFKSGRGWNGCLTLPRSLTLGSGGKLIQSPVPEVAALRSRRTSKAAAPLQAGTNEVKIATTDVSEILADILPGDSKSVRLDILKAGEQRPIVSVAHDGSTLSVLDTKAPFALAPGEKSLRLHVFLDRSVVEVYANDRVCVTRVIEPGAGELSLLAAGGNATLNSLDVWELKPIW
jgi:beta-fructofuranosidase